MRWEVFYNEDTATVTVVDALPYEPQLLPEYGGSIGVLETEPGAGFIITKSNSLIKTWITERFKLLGIKTPDEGITLVHMPNI